MSKLSTYIDFNFPGFLLRKPVFYRWPIGLRFELGTDKKGQVYFSNVIDRAKELYDSIINDGDRILLIYQLYTGQNYKNDVKNFCFNYINHFDKSVIEYEQLTNLYLPKDNNDLWTRVIIETTANQIDIKRLLTAISNWDFQDRTPQIEGEVYFVDTTKNIIFHMYDDRGVDIIAKDKNSLRKLHHDFSDWILDYDREIIDENFKK